MFTRKQNTSRWHLSCPPLATPQLSVLRRAEARRKSFTKFLNTVSQCLHKIEDSTEESVKEAFVWKQLPG